MLIMLLRIATEFCLKILQCGSNTDSVTPQTGCIISRDNSPAAYVKSLQVDVCRPSNPT